MLKLVAPDQYVVKFLRYSDASNLLNSKSKLSNLVYVKPDLSPEERAMESLLLKEWRSLIEMGVARQFNNKAYFMFNKLHAKIFKINNCNAYYALKLMILIKFYPIILIQYTHKLKIISLNCRSIR